jgi:CRP-like cAMP-binding protein
MRLADFVNRQVFQTWNHRRLNMKAYYLAVEEKSIRKSIYPITGTVTIGRGRDNTVVLSDPTVSRSHAKVEYSDGTWLLEDTASANGIFVDDNRVESAVLESGKTYHIGKVALRLIQEDDSTPRGHFLKTAEILSTSFDDLALLADKERGKPWSKRLLRGIEQVPFFAPMSKAELSNLANGANLHIFQEAQAIFSEGDRARSIYVVLEGRVRIFLRDHCGRALDLATLEVGDFFGEMSFLTGKPRSANATTLVSSLLIEIGYLSLKSLITAQPQAKKILLECYRKRLAGNKKTFTDLDFEERRRDPRLRDTLPVRLALIAESHRKSGNRPNSWETSSVDISISGIRVVLYGADPKRIHSGDGVDLKIELPDPWKSIQCVGQIRKAWISPDHPKTIVLGIKFINMPLIYSKKLKEYIYGDTHIEE